MNVTVKEKETTRPRPHPRNEFHFAELVCGPCSRHCQLALMHYRVEAGMQMYFANVWPVYCPAVAFPGVALALRCVRLLSRCAACACSPLGRVGCACCVAVYSGFMCRGLHCRWQRQKEGQLLLCHVRLTCSMLHVACIAQSQPHALHSSRTATCIAHR